MPLKVFFCYAHEDERFVNKLKMHLRPLERQGLINFWYDRNINAGTEWEQEIDKLLNTADIILLLVSPDYMNSEYCYSIEMKLALKRHERREACVIPIILRHVYWQIEQLKKLQALPSDGKPITDRYWHDQDEALFSVAEGLRSVIEKLFTKQIALSKTTREVSSYDSRTLRKDESSLLDHLLAPNFKRLCPSCIEEFYPGDCRVISQTTGEVLIQPPVEWIGKQLARRKPEALTSSYYLDKQARRECPNCGYLLPYNIELAENVSIAIVGDVMSGKSHYVASVAHEIQERWMKENRKFVQVTCLTPDVEDQFVCVFHDRMQIEPTQAARTAFHRPLIYELKLSKLSKQPARRLNLILYDGSGEDQTREERIKLYAKYILTANAIVFLVDPFLIPTITERIPWYRKPDRGTEEDIYSRPSRVYEVLDTTIEVFKRFHGSKAKERLRSLPFALMLSKSDLFKYMVPKAPSYRFLSNAVYRSSVDLQDAREIHKEVRSIIEDSRERTLLRLIQKFSKVNFFATSATGCKVEDNGAFQFIDPCRCLDPILWIFHQLGIVQSFDEN